MTSLFAGIAASKLGEKFKYTGGRDRRAQQGWQRDHDVGARFEWVEAPVSNVVDDLPVEARQVVTEVLGEHDAALLASLRSRSEPIQEERLAVEDLLSTEFCNHLDPNDEPTVEGTAIDDALGTFLLRWPTEQG